MDDSENYSSGQPKAFGMNNQQGYSSSIRLKIPARSTTTNSRASTQYAVKEDDKLEDEVIGEDVEETNGVRMVGKDSCDDEDEDEDDVTGDDDEEDDEDDGGVGKRYIGKVGDIGMQQPQKKRKSKSLISNYEFAPRPRAPPAHIGVQPQPSSAGQDIVPSWSDQETFALLDAWGERFFRQGRKSLQSEEWQEVAKKVSQVTDIERSDVQCRSRLDALKKKYMKEKMKSATGGGGGVSKWPFFRKMEILLSSPSECPAGLSCGIDSGEYVFMNPKVYLSRASGLDQMRDSPDSSESSKGDEDQLQSKGKKHKAKTIGIASFELLADSIQKFSDIYENIELSKQKQMAELESMRMDVLRQLETQRRQILERAQAEIVKISQGGDCENDLSGENISG